MNYLLPSINPFSRLSKRSPTNQEDDDTLTKIKMQTQNAREQLQDAIIDDDDSVNLILRDSGIGKLRHQFDYDQLDKRIRQRELLSAKRREDMNRRLKLKELQLFPNTQRRTSTEPLHHVELEDSIDATMRKSPTRKEYNLIPSPLPVSPPESIKQWKEKLRETRYELPTQEEKRLQQKLDRSRSNGARVDELGGENENMLRNTPVLANQEAANGRLRRDSTEDVLAKVDRRHTSFDDDKFFSFTENSPVKSKYNQIDKLMGQIEQLKNENEHLEQESFELVKERDYWKHKTNITMLENEQLSNTNEELRSKIKILKDENKRLFEYSSRKHNDNDESLMMSKVRPSPKHRMRFDADDTTQLIKYASRSLEYEPILK